MKRTIAIIMTLVLAVLCCLTVQAEVKDEILFEGIAWGSDLETVKKAMQDAGWVNEEGLERFEQEAEVLDLKRTRGFGAGSEYSYEHFDREDGLYIVNRDDDESANVMDVTLMSNMVAKPWMGVEIHNISLLFALDGDTEKLVFADVSLMVNREDLRPGFERLYGTPDERNGEYHSVIWLGASGTAVMYDETNVYFGLLNAKEIVDASQMNTAEDPRMRRPGKRQDAEPTPEPTPLPEVTGADLLDYVGQGEITFLGIPWDSDVETAMNAMIGQQLIPESERSRLKFHEADNGLALSDEGDHWQMLFVGKPDWITYYFWNYNTEIGKTCCGHPVDSVQLTFRKDGDRTRLKCAEVTIRQVDGGAVRQEVRQRVLPVLGEDHEWYGSFFWNGENGTVLETNGLENNCTVTFGIHVPEE